MDNMASYAYVVDIRPTDPAMWASVTTAMASHDVLSLTYDRSHNVIRIVFPSHEASMIINTLLQKHPFTLVGEGYMCSVPKRSNLSNPLIMTRELASRLERQEHFNWPTLSPVDIWAR
jgi:hypothetical protein